MKIFEAEKNLGLEKSIRANASINYLSPVVPSKIVYRSKASTDNSDPLLYKMTDVLASTGWNLNDDVFDPYETWSARNSPVNKPFDIEHEESNIIGHITASRAIKGDMDDANSDYEEIPDDSSIADLPNKFHILNDSVIYKTWSDEQKLEDTEAMIQEIEDGEWFVSMECKFSGFDYSVLSPDGEERVVERNDDTAALTKYLRAYGGTGQYTDKATGSVYKIGRVMKNIMFSGKGLVKKPANPESVIINKEENVQASENKVYITEVDVDTNSYQEINIMSDELKDALAKLELASKEIETLKASQTSSQIKTLEDTIASLNTQLEASKSTVATVSTANDDLSTRLANAEQELEVLKAAKKKADRFKKMKDAGAEDESDMEACLAKFEKLDDETFDTVIATMSIGWKAGKVEKVEASTASKTIEKVIDSAERTEKTVDISSASTESKVESTRASIADKMLGRIKKSK